MKDPSIKDHSKQIIWRKVVFLGNFGGRGAFEEKRRKVPQRKELVFYFQSDGKFKTVYT